MSRYGIRITMPATDPMNAPHLLGEEWEAFRWYDTEVERDHAFNVMQRQPGYYRRGDSPSVILEKVDQ